MRRSEFFLQGDQKENKPEQVSQIIGHVVAEFYANMQVGNIVVHFIIIIYQGLLSNAIPLVGRFFAEMSKKRQFLSSGVLC
jgi:hypothetical protein